MSQFSSRGAGYSATTPSENMILVRRRDTPTDGTRRGIICLHGRVADCGQFQPHGSASHVGDPGYHAWQLAEAGYIVLAIDDGGGVDYGNSVAMARLDDGYTYLSTVGAKSGKCGLMGWSMGGIGSLNWIKRNPSKVGAAWLWSPLTDLDWANSTGGYTPAYATGGVTAQAQFGTEIQAAYSPYATASNGYRIRDEYSSWNGIGVPIRVCHASDDATVPVGMSQAFVAGVNDSAVSMRSPIPTGDHTGLFANVPASEVIAFYQANMAA